jgi:ABC-type sugar transport system ATPase subunit
LLYVKNLNLQAGDFKVPDTSFDVKKGEYYFLLGESGSGKSLILEAIAGIQKIKSGEVWVNNLNITHLPMHQRRVGLVFQSLALFPHLTVMDNIAFPLERRGIKRPQVAEEVVQIAQRLSIAHVLKRKPGTLSGGEHQRVALARTLIMKPDMLLLDEPLSSLDILLKEEMVELLRELHQQGQTILHVTHDYRVVGSLANRISIIQKGLLLQTGTPQEIASNPKCKLASRIVV